MESDDDLELLDELGGEPVEIELLMLGDLRDDIERVMNLLERMQQQHKRLTGRRFVKPLRLR